MPETLSHASARHDTAVRHQHADTERRGYQRPLTARGQMLVQWPAARWIVIWPQACALTLGNHTIAYPDDSPACPLCAGRPCSHYYRDQRRTYRQCSHCTLVFVPTEYHLSPAQEKAEYDKHHNNVDDPGYRRFLARLAAPLSTRLTSGASGLDFGCGPGPALAAMLRESGFAMSLYDPYYQPDRSALQRQYDFITATEVVEHLAQPGLEMRRLWPLLRPGGHLGLMTKLVIDKPRFANWHYIRDPTHIAFFSHSSLAWLAASLGARLELIGNDVALLSKAPDNIYSEHGPL